MKTRMKILGILAGTMVAASANAAELDVGCYVTQPQEGHNPMPHGRNAIGVHIVKTDEGQYIAHIQEVFLSYEQVEAASDPVFSIPVRRVRLCGGYEPEIYSGEGIFLDNSGMLSLTIENQMQEYRVRKVETRIPNFCGGLK